MNALPKFTFAPAVRERVGLLIGLAGASGSGKTMSALRIARGLAGGDDNRIAFIDTEGGRGLHYAPTRGQKANGDKFAFQHGDLHAPFTPEAYMAAIASADEAGFEVIVIDSVSHSWEGEGGLQDMHTDLVEKAVEKARSDATEKGWSFNEAAVADRSSIGAWKEPKMRHKRFISRLLQCRAHLVLCFRADEKMRMETVEEQGKNGKTYKKTVITQPKDLPPGERWAPICERRMPYELTVSLILTPAEPGIPIPIKLQAQHRSAVREGEFLSEETGRALAEWARGGGAAPVAGDTRARDVRATGDIAAQAGTTVLRQFWTGLTKADKALVGGAAQLAAWKVIAEAADAPDVDFDEPNGKGAPPPTTQGGAPAEGEPAAETITNPGDYPGLSHDEAGNGGGVGGWIERSGNGATTVAPSTAASTEAGNAAPRQGPQEGAGGASSPRVSPAPTDRELPSDEARKARVAEIRAEAQAKAEEGTDAHTKYWEDRRKAGEADMLGNVAKSALYEVAKRADAAKGRK